MVSKRECQNRKNVSLKNLKFHFQISFFVVGPSSVFTNFLIFNSICSVLNFKNSCRFKRASVKLSGLTLLTYRLQLGVGPHNKQTSGRCSAIISAFFCIFHFDGSLRQRVSPNRISIVLKLNFEDFEQLSVSFPKLQ